MRRRLLFAYCGVLVLLAAGSAGAEPEAATAGASARAYAIKVIVPGQGGGATTEVTAPPEAVQFGAGFSYPGDGSVMTSGAFTSSASASAREGAASASASAQVAGISLFGGEVTVGRVVVRATANAASGDATGDLSQSAVEGLTVGGQPAGGGRVALGDWGYAVTLAQASVPSNDGFRGFVSGLQVVVTADHNGIPAGTQILIGYAEAVARAEKLPATAAKPAPAPKEVGAPAGSGPARSSAAPKPTTIPELVRRPLPSLVPRVTTKGYVFPVHGPSSFTDTFGAARAVVGWHHGEDIFAPHGAPVLAVAKGTVFSVGWNDIGGNRLWLRDTKGNEFYYAHLSAFTPLAINGASVQAGDVLGFVGNSGDAEATPPHLHFEFHPVGMLSLGYDGVVNPYPFLSAWRRLEDVEFVAGLGWVPDAGQRRRAPRPGAFLVDAADISSASGLDARAVRRALADAADEPREADVSAEAPVP